MTRMRVWRCFSVVIAVAFILGVGAMAVPAGLARADGPTWAIQILDADEVVSTSLALDSNDNPYISYCTGGFDSVRYTYWTGAAWAKDTVDDGPAYVTSLALDSYGFTHIAYITPSGASLHYAHLTGGGWVKDIVDDRDIRDCSLAVDGNNRPHIAYILGDSGYLLYTHWTGAAWATETVDDTYVFGSCSLALDGQDHAHISYSSVGDHSLYYAYWTGAAWAKEVVDPTDVICTSIALDSNGYPYIAYGTANIGTFSLHYAYRAGAGWATQIVDPVDVFDCSLALDSNNFPHISYYASTGGLFDSVGQTMTGMLKYAHWTGGAWDIQTVDQATLTLGGQNHTEQGTALLIGGGKWSSIALNSSDLPRISYGSLIPFTILGTLHYAELNPPIDEGPLPPGQPARLRRSLAPSSPPSTSIQFNPANMSLQYLSVNPQQTTANQPVTISTNVVNTGNEGGNYQVALKINGELVETRMVSVGPLATQPVKFTVSRANPGTYDVAILDKTGSFTVLGGGAAAGSKVGGMIALVVIAILIIGTVVVLVLRYT
jgi:hypothetical protein